MTGERLLPGRPLAELLLARFASGGQAAAAVGVDRSAISLWANGKRRAGFYLVDRVCVALGVHPAEIYGADWWAVEPAR